MGAGVGECLYWGEGCFGVGVSVDVDVLRYYCNYTVRVVMGVELQVQQALICVPLNNN